MSRLLILQPLPIAAVTANRGSGAANLATRDPKEAWVDSAVGTSSTLTIDFGASVTIDTIYLGGVFQASAGASWAISGGATSSAETVIQPLTLLRVQDVAGAMPATTFALWRGAPRALRYLALTLLQPSGFPPLAAGVLATGEAFVAAKGQEWGAGRRPIDTGSATPLPGGGFGVVEGARKRDFSWTFGDLSIAETDRLELIALELGSTAPGVVIEDPDRTAGLASRGHYGLLRWRQYERRNRAQTRWEIGIEQWI